MAKKLWPKSKGRRIQVYIMDKSMDADLVKLRAKLPFSIAETKFAEGLLKLGLETYKKNGGKF